MGAPVYVLGGYQSDFARHWTREGLGLYELFEHTLHGGIEQVGIEPARVEAAHVGNFAAEIFCGQGQLGGFFAQAIPEWSGLPTARHEAACASGSVALLAATAEIEAGRYDVVVVLGVELMRNVPGAVAAGHLDAAAWVGRETEPGSPVWPRVFSRVGDEYERRYGLDRRHLARIAEINFSNARRNPNAQTRGWTLDARSFSDDASANPLVAGRLRRHDCAQITDGAVCVVLASETAARAHAARNGRPLDRLARIRGWGHRSAPMAFETKLAAGRDTPYLFPHVRGAVRDAFARAELDGVRELDGIELHDCFTTTEYMAIDHLDLTPPGESWRAVEEGTIERDGALPINPSGGLIGAGHPVGASGVRMLLDACRQVTGTAGEYQIEGARRFATLNIGGSTTTAVSLIVATD